MNFQITLNEFLLISPMLVIFLMSLIPITLKVLRGNKEQNALLTLAIGLTGLVAGAGLSVVFGGSGSVAFNKTLVFDGLSLWLGILAILSAGAGLVLAYENPSTKGEQFSELVFLAMNAAVGMLVLVTAVDLLMIFLGLELMSLSLYLMIGMSHEHRVSKEAAFKYFVLGSLASAIYLYGVSFVFGTTGSTNILNFLQSTASLVSANRLFMFGIVLVIVGFLFKISIAPFHAWTPDVYQGAPTPHTAVMATAVKAVCVAALLRIFASRVLVGSDKILVIMQWLAVITMLVGNMAAIVQGNMKRMLAYSGIAHSGYLMVGMIASGISETATFGAASVVFYLIGYTVMTLGAFSIINLIERTESHSLNVEDLAGFAKIRPGLAFCLTLFLLSMAGIPPLIGFFGKFYLFNAAIAEGLLWLAIWGVLNSVISAYYYLRPIVIMYMKDGNADIAPHPVSGTMMATLVSAIVVTLLGFFSGGLFDAVEKSLF